MPLDDLLADQFLDVVIIKDLKKFYTQMIESINGNQTNSLIYLDRSSLKNAQEKQAPNGASIIINESFLISESNYGKHLDLKEDKTISASYSNERITNNKMRSNKNEKSSLPKQIRKSYLRKMLFLKGNKKDANIVKGLDAKSNVKMVVECKDKLIKGQLSTVKSDESSINTDSTKSTSKQSFIRKLLNVCRSIRRSPIKNKKLLARTKIKSDKKENKKKKFENTAFLSIELQMGLYSVFFSFFFFYCFNNN